MRQKNPDLPALAATSTDTDRAASLPAIVGLEESTELTTRAAKILRAESLVLKGDPQPVEQFVTLLNERIGTLVDTVKRWWDGGFGDAAGEDPAMRDQMRVFCEVALENIQAKHLVRVFEHLSRGTLHQSATGLISGATRRTPADGLLERAVKKDDTEAIERFRTYLGVVDTIRDTNLRPLAVIDQWRDQFGAKGAYWSAVIVQDAAEYLRHHVKLVDRWESLETARLKDLEKFKKSPVGKKYLAVRELVCPEGLPRNREERFQALSDERAVRWKSDKAVLVPASSLKTLLDKNPVLRELIAADIQFARLTKPNTPPTWTPVSAENRRWPFIPTSMIEGAPKRIGSELKFQVALPLEAGEGGDIRFGQVELSFAQTSRFQSLKQHRSAEGEVVPWSFERRDDISGNTMCLQVKGFRLDHDRSAGWNGRFSWEKVGGSPQNPRTAALMEAAAKRRAPELAPGDVICVFSLEPSEKAKDRKGDRAGWIDVYGINDAGERQVLYRNGIYSYAAQEQHGRSMRRGQKTWFGGEPGANSGKGPRTVHGDTKGLSLAQLLDADQTLKREVRFIRILKDPERRGEALEWLDARIAGKQREGKNDPAVPRLLRMRERLASGEAPSHGDLKPLKERITSLRTRLDGMKDSYRQAVAKEVIRTVHDIRSGKASGALNQFYTRHGDKGAMLLVIENHKTKGPGTFRTNAFNRVGIVAGASTICHLIEEKAAVTEPSVSVASVYPPRLNDESAKLAEAQKLPKMRVSALRIAQGFFTPPEKKKAEPAAE